MPVAASYEKEGSISNSGRLIQWRYKAIAAPGKAEDDLQIINELGKEIKALYAADPKAAFPAPINNMTWNYGDKIDPNVVAAEINGYYVGTNKPMAKFADLQADGSTACGCWIYSGYFNNADVTKAPCKKRDNTTDTTGLGIFKDWAYQLAGEPPDHLQQALLRRCRNSVESEQGTGCVGWREVDHQRRA